MTVKSYQVTVSSSPTRIVTAPQGLGNRKAKIYVANLSGTEDVWVGDQNVSATTGYQIVKTAGQTIGYRQEFELFGGESLYAFAATGSVQVAVIVSGL